ncbi:PQQ-binding-like beta-propeller repeat protein [Halalkalicoccus sp. GCM10025322]|uniref:outer membrane protein assembly factor BamB family protein n=2 Tax=Halococcaceae TaxID=1963270 RepID=UPI002F96DFF8
MDNTTSSQLFDGNSTRRKFLLAAGAVTTSSLLASTATATHSDHGARSASQRTSSAENETDWPQHRYNGAHTGYHPTAQGPQTGLEERWRFEANTTTDPVVSNGVVYASGQVIDSESDEYYESRRLYALDAADGIPLWVVDPETEVNALAVDDRQLYTSGGSLRAYSRSDGSVQWTSPISTSAPLTTGGLALVGRRLYVTDRETVYSINTASGTVIWQRTLGSRLTPPAVDGKCVYVGRVAGEGGLDRTVLALGTQTGRVQWEQQLDPPFASEANIEGPPVVANGRVYLRITAGGEEDVFGAPVYSLVSLNRATGGDVQQVGTHGGFDLLPIAAGDGHVYTAAIDYDMVSALSASEADGTGGWSIAEYSMDFGVSTAPVVANGVLYVGADSDVFGVETNALYAIEASTGTLIATLDLPITGNPVVVEGSVYVVSDGILYAIEEPPIEE